VKAPVAAVATEEALVAECVAAWRSRQQRLQNPHGDIPLRIIAAAVGLRQVPDPDAREEFPDDLSRLLDTFAAAAAGLDPIRTTGELFARLVSQMSARDLRRWRTNIGRVPKDEE